MSKRTFVSLAFCLAGIFALYGQEENQNNYGVDEANTKFSLQSGVLGGRGLYGCVRRTAGVGAAERDRRVDSRSGGRALPRDVFSGYRL